MAWIVVKLPEVCGVARLSRLVQSFTFLPYLALQWTSWVLLVALALYDLCAVLTPCGPLKALVKLAQARPEQPIPGLLYEAEVSENGDAGALRHLLDTQSNMQVGTGHEGRLRDTFAGSG